MSERANIKFVVPKELVADKMEELERACPGQVFLVDDPTDFIMGPTKISVPDIIKYLREADRCGAVSDKPEGSKYIIISDTLANQMADALEKAFSCTKQQR